MAKRRKNLLRTVCGRLPRDDAFLALQGASYHLWNVSDLLQKGLMHDDEIRRFHWHLRAFFWEMVAVRDSLARESDQEVSAGVKRLGGSQWFREVEAYRNFAHQSFQAVEALVPAETRKAEAFCLHAPFKTVSHAGDGLAQLRAYWHEMEGFLKGLFR